MVDKLLTIEPTTTECNQIDFLWTQTVSLPIQQTLIHIVWQTLQEQRSPY
ncbi:hypothetical protein U2718_028950 [Chlorogloeopsis sp. ULAP02]